MLDLNSVPTRARMSALSFVSDAMRIGHPSALEAPGVWVDRLAGYLNQGDLKDLEYRMFLLRAFTTQADTAESAIARTEKLFAYASTGDVSQVSIGGRPLVGGPSKIVMGVPGDEDDEAAD